MTPHVKICGLTRPTDVESAIEFGASYLGFIVEAKSPRRLSVEQAARLARPAKSIAKTVAVTVNADNDLLQAIVTRMQPDFIQCHGDEGSHRVDFIRSAYKVGVIKAFSVKDPEDLHPISDYSCADMILLDTKAPKTHRTVRGGHGIPFDWDILRNARLPKTYLLAGGLNPENIQTCRAKTNAPIFDVSSGVESAPGIKDAQKIQAFMNAVRK